MENIQEKSYEKLIIYVKENILLNNFTVGDRLPSERDLAIKLEISRNSVREGIRILERIGVISSQHGAGNYITGKFDITLTEVMSMMYVLRGMDMEKITEFRFGLEFGALNLAIKNITVEQKEELKKYLNSMESSKDEKVRAKFDKKMHYLLVEASGNYFITSSFQALNEIMEQYVPKMREKIFKGMKTEKELEVAHRELVEGVIEEDVNKANNALLNHFKYIRQFLEVELD